jgi:hypothetical protein
VRKFVPGRELAGVSVYLRVLALYPSLSPDPSPSLDDGQDGRDGRDRRGRAGLVWFIHELVKGMA